MPKVAQAHLDARRAQVLAAARECFIRDGFHATTVHDICRDGGFSTGLLYQYFTSKEMLVADLITEAVGHEMAVLDQAAAAPTAVAAFEALGAGLLGGDQPVSSGTSPQFALQYWAEVARNERLREATAGLRDRYLHVIGGIVERGQQQGEIAAHVAPEAVARVFIAFGQGLLLQMTWGQQVDVSDCVQVIRSLVLGDFLGGGDVTGRIPPPPDKNTPRGGSSSQQAARRRSRRP